jgi:hypothetical protein
MQVFEQRSSGGLVCTVSILVLLLSPELAVGRKPELSATGITRGKTAAGFYYLSGGFGFDEQLAVERQAARYNLKLVFAPKLGHSISPVLLLIGHNRSRSIDKIQLHGPSLYLQLPVGVYTLMARIKNKVVLVRDVFLDENRRTIHFAYGR